MDNMKVKQSLFTDTEHYTTEAHEIEAQMIEALEGIFKKYSSEYKIRDLEYIANVSVDLVSAEIIIGLHTNAHDN
jgi:hypothetical protein